MCEKEHKSQWIEIGNISKAFGIKGYFYLNTYLEDFSDKHSLLIIKEKNSQPIKIIDIKKHKERLVLKLQGIEDRTKVENLRGEKVWAQKNFCENSYDKLIGYKVVDCNGKILGQVEQFYNFGAGDLLEIRKDDLTLQIPFQDELIEKQKSDNQINLKVPGELYQDLWTTNLNK
jgi:16S rRNA processing protein RimM